MSFDTNIKRIRSPYIDEVAAPSSQIRSAQKPRSPYLDEAKDKLTWSTKHPKKAHAKINLRATRLGWRERYELVSLRASEAVSRILWLSEDAIIVFKPGAEFGETQNLPRFGAIYDLFASLRLPRINLRRSWLRHLGVYLGITLLVFAFFNLPGLINQTKYALNPPKVSTPGNLASAGTPSVAAKPAPTQAFRIMIPKIGKDAPVVLSSSRDSKAMAADLENGVAHYSGTALPGEDGNVALTGHSSNYWWDKGAYNYVFQNLNSLNAGDQIILYYGGGTYTYQVTAKQVVSPNESQVLNPTSSKTLTLITCWPVYTNWQRLVVTATQIDPPQGASGSAGSHLPGS
jgi:sortase A